MLTTNSLNFEDPEFNRDSLSMDEIMKLINHKTESEVVVEFDKTSEKELNEFCNQHGIIGFNCGNMPPKVALEILKNRIGDVKHVVKNLESQGYEIVEKSYKSRKQLLNG
jgi:hypothetical protein